MREKGNNSYKAVECDMTELKAKIEAVQTWINGLQQKSADDSFESNITAEEAALDKILDLINPVVTHPSSEQDISATSDELVRRIQEQSTALTQASNALKGQLEAHEKAEILYCGGFSGTDQAGAKRG
jgi:methyl-accepting chemotaxis protein